MNTFVAFTRKEFFHILRDRRTLVILIGMPVIQMLLFGFAIRNEIQDVEVLIVDSSNDFVTQEITNKLLASKYFRSVGRHIHSDAVPSAFQHGRAREAIVFEPRFAEQLFREGHATVQVITDATDPNVANTVFAYTGAVLRDYQSHLNPAGPEAAIVPHVRMRFNPELESVNLFVPGLIALILMLVCALMTSITITREKELGTMEVLLVSPLRPYQIIAGKVSPYLVLSMVNLLTILFLAAFVFDVPIRGSIALLMAQCLLFIVCALSLGILVSARTNTQQTAMMISLAGLLLPTVILSGFIFPISSMPGVLQLVSHIVPAKWFLIIVRGIMIRGVGMQYLWVETAVLILMTAAFLTLSIRSFSVRLEDRTA